MGQTVADSLEERAGYRRLDVRAEPDRQSVTESCLARHGARHIVVNNAAVTGLEEAGGPHDPERGSLKDRHAVHRTNLDGVFLGCKHAISSMRKSGAGGSIINIFSRSPSR